MVIDVSSSGIIDTMSVDNSVLLRLLELINNIYVLLGGVVGIWILFFIYRLYDNYKLRRQFKRIEDDIQEIKAVLLLLPKKKKRKTHLRTKLSKINIIKKRKR